MRPPLSLRVLPIILLLVGCTQPSPLLVKEGISQQQLQSDLLECDKDQTALGDFKRSNEDFSRCIKAKGYREAKPNENGLARPLTR